MGTAYENAVGTAQALAQLKANIDEPFIRFGERMRGAKPADLNVIPKALGKAKEWSPLQYEKGTVTYDPEWGQVTKKPITEAFEKFKQGPSLKDVTGDITKAPQWLAQGVGKMGPQFAAAGGATALTGPFGGILMNAVNNIGERYNTALKEKVNAPASGIFTGLLISAFDTLGPWLQLRGITKGLLSTAGVGGGTELVQEIMAILHEKFLGIPVKDPFWRLMENFLLGMFIEGGTHAAARPSKAAPQVSTEPPPPPPPGGPPPPPPPAAPPTTPAPPSGTPEFTQWAAENGIRTDEKGGFDPSFDPMQATPPPAAAPAVQPSVEIQPPQPAAPVAVPVQPAAAPFLHASSQPLPKIGDRIQGRDADVGLALAPSVGITGVVTEIRRDPITGDMFPIIDGQHPAIEWRPAPETIPDANQPDMVVEGPNGPQAVRSEDVFTEQTLQAGGMQEPSAWQARVAASKERLAKRGGTLSSNPFTDVEWITDMAVVIADDIRVGAIKLGNAIEHIVAKFGPEARVVAPQVFQQAQDLVKAEKLTAAGTTIPGPQTAPGAPAATSASVTAAPPTGASQGQPAPGMIRVYRVDTSSKTGKGVPEWMQGNEKFEAIKDAKGRWFSTEESDIEYYLNKEADPGAAVSYIDLPAAVAERFTVKNLPGDIRKFSARPDTEVFLPRQVANQAQPYVAQPTGSPQGQPAPVTPAPVRPALGAMPDATDPGRSDAQRFGDSVKSFGKLQRLLTQFRWAAWKFKDFAPIQAMLKAKDRLEINVFRWKDRGGEIAKAWRNLGAEQAQAVSDLAFAATKASDTFQRKLSPEELARTGDLYGVSEKGYEVYHQIQQFFHDSWEALRQATISELQREISDPDALAKATAEINAQFDEKMKGNYFPLDRFGQWMVVAKRRDANGKLQVDQVEHLPTEHAAKDAARAMEKRYRDEGITIEPGGIRIMENTTAEARDAGYLPPAVTRKLAGKLAADLNLTDEQRATFEAAFDQIIAASMNQRSFFSRLNRRKGTKGFSRDAQRAFSAYVSSIANHIGRTEQRGNLEQSVLDAEKWRNEMTSGTNAIVNTSHVNRLTDLMKDTKTALLNPKVQNNSIVGAAATWFLGFGPVQIYQNFVQVINVANVLAAEVGMPRAAWETMRAMKDVTKVYTKRAYDRTSHKVRMKLRGGGEYETYQENYTGPLSEEDWAVLQRGRGEGLTGDSNAHQIAGLANISTFEQGLTGIFGLHPLGFGKEGGTDVQGVGRGIDKLFKTFGEWSLAGHQWSEEWTRRVGLLASSRAFAKQGHPDPYMAARDVVLKAQGSHEASNRSMLQRGLAIPLIFKSFLMNNIWLQTQSQAKMKLFITQLFLGGLRGFLGAAPIMALINALGTWLRKKMGTKDPYLDIQQTVRELIARSTSEEVADYAINGANSKIGPYDLKDAFSQADPIPGVDEAIKMASGRMNAKTGFWNIGEEVGGPWGGQLMTATKAAVEGGPASEQFLKTVMPAWMARAERMRETFRDEQISSASGEKVVSIDTSNPSHVAEAVGVALGARSGRAAKAQEQQYANAELSIYYNGLLDGMQRKYNAAYSRTGNPEERALVHEEIAKINKILPQSFERTLGTYHRSFMMRDRKQNLEESGTPAGPHRQRQFMRDRLKGLYPDTYPMQR
jgi:hypothetical protein